MPAISLGIGARGLRVSLLILFKVYKYIGTTQQILKKKSKWQKNLILNQAIYMIFVQIFDDLIVTVGFATTHIVIVVFLWVCIAGFA